MTTIELHDHSILKIPSYTEGIYGLTSEEIAILIDLYMRKTSILKCAFTLRMREEEVELCYEQLRRILE